MNRRKVIITVLAVMLALIVFRLIQLCGYPIWEGTSRGSPNGKFTAMPSTRTDKSFFGRERHYYEFAVFDESGQFVRRVAVEDNLKKQTQWRFEGSIEWAADSAQVTFSNANMRLTLMLNP